MKLRIIKNILKVIEKWRSGDTANLVKSSCKNFKTLYKKGHFIAEEVNFQEEF